MTGNQNGKHQAMLRTGATGKTIDYQENSLLLNKLPVELILKILNISTTSNHPLNICSLKWPWEDSLWNGRICMLPWTHQCEQIASYRALILTCRVFHTCICTNNIPFTHNIFRFCSFEEISFLKSLKPKQYEAIRSIYLCSIPSRPLSLFSSLGYCSGLRSLVLNIDAHAAEWFLLNPERIPVVWVDPDSCYRMGPMPNLKDVWGLNHMELSTTESNVMEFEGAGTWADGEEAYFAEVLHVRKENITEERRKSWFMKLSRLEEDIRAIVTRPRYAPLPLTLFST